MFNNQSVKYFPVTSLLQGDFFFSQSANTTSMTNMQRANDT